MLPSGNDPAGTTPISADEVRYLIPSVATHQELNQRERENILSARRWAFSPRARRTPQTCWIIFLCGSCIGACSMKYGAGLVKRATTR